MQSITSAYINRILVPELAKFGVSESGIKAISSSVSSQMTSALYNWEDDAFRKTLLLLVSEEAPFYMPAENTDVNGFVVLTVRNSLFESLQSNHYVEYGLQERLSDPQIVEITSTAIKHFNKVGLEESDDTEYQPEDDMYWHLSQKYPVAWNSLTAIANTEQQAIQFNGMRRLDQKKYNEAFIKQYKTSSYGFAVEDGFDSSIGSQLQENLQWVTEHKSCLLVDSFKMLSRNIEKLLSVIEYLLINDCSFATANYFIANGYAEKRISTLKAASSRNAEKDMYEHFSNLTGVGETHARYLRAYLQG